MIFSENESNNEKIVRYCKEAKDKIAKLEQNESNQIIDVKKKTEISKKQIIRNLAKQIELEGLVPIETISTVISHQGVAAPTYVRECLDPKYKNTARSENAKKQKKKHEELEVKVLIEDLAKVASLKQQEKMENNEITIPDSSGQILIKKDKDTEVNEMEDSTKSPVDKNLAVQYPPVLEINQKDLSEKGCPDCKIKDEVIRGKRC